MELDGALDEPMDGIRTHTLLISPAILNLIAEIDEFKGAWAAIGRISPRLTGANRNTIKDHLSAPTNAKHLERHGKGRGTWCSIA